MPPPFPSNVEAMVLSETVNMSKGPEPNPIYIPAPSPVVGRVSASAGWITLPEMVVPEMVVAHAQIPAPSPKLPSATLMTLWEIDPPVMAVVPESASMPPP